MPQRVKGWSLKDGERWFLAHTLPRREQQARLHLQAQGFRVHLPQLMRTTRHARQLRTALAPLFPRYLFLILNLERDRWLSVRSTIGIAHLVSCDSRPLPVPVGVVESLIERTENDVTLLDEDLVKGQPVRVLSGPFADFVGTLKQLEGNGRVRVLLQLMGATIPVALHRSALAPAA